MNEQQMAAIKAWFEAKTAEDGCKVQVDEYDPESGMAWVELSAGGWCSWSEYHISWTPDGQVETVMQQRRRGWI